MVSVFNLERSTGEKQVCFTPTTISKKPIKQKRVADGNPFPLYYNLFSYSLIASLIFSVAFFTSILIGSTTFLFNVSPAAFRNFPPLKIWMVY